MAELPLSRGLIDTLVVIDLDRLEASVLPAELAVSTVTMAELVAGLHATQDLAEGGRRQDRQQRAEATFDPRPIDAAVARAYGRVYAEVVASGRKVRGRRALDLLIAATALAADLPLYTRNPDDFLELDPLVKVVAVRSAQDRSAPGSRAGKSQPGRVSSTAATAEQDPESTFPAASASFDRGRWATSNDPWSRLVPEGPDGTGRWRNATTAAPACRAAVKGVHPHTARRRSNRYLGPKPPVRPCRCSSWRWRCSGQRGRETLR